MYRDFLENRKAAQAIKARVEQYERGGGNVGRMLGGGAIGGDEGYVPSQSYVSGN